MHIKVLDRLFLKGFIGPYILSFFIVEFVLVMQYLWKVIDDILGKGYSLFDYFELLIYLSIVLIPMALPLTILLSSVMIFGEMAEKHELMSLKSAGVSLYRMLRPGLIIAIMTMCFSLLASNILKPEANRRFMKKIKDMKTNQLTFVFDEKIFNKEFKNYSIWIDKKYEDGRTIEGIRIYDHTDADKTVLDMTYAKHGEMYTTYDQKYLIMELSEGYMIKEVRSESADKLEKTFNRLGRPINRVYFKKLKKAFELSKLLNLRMNNISNNQYDLLNTFELYKTIDSLKNGIVQTKLDNMYRFNGMTKNYKKDEDDIDKSINNNSQNTNKKIINKQEQIKSTLKARNQNNSKNKSYSPSVNLPPVLKDLNHFRNANTFADLILPSAKEDVIDKTLRNATGIRDRSYNKLNELRIKTRDKENYTLRFFQQYSWALVCLIFLFIGGPAGAIVRKGGFGFPLLIAIGFYMVFIMSYITGEKLLKSGTLQAFGAAWLPCFILLPFAIYLTWLSLHDKNVTGIKIINKIKEKLKIESE